MRDSHVLLYRASDRVEASLLAHVLETADIPVALVGGNALDETAESARTELWVLREDQDRGRQVIEEYQRRNARMDGPWWRLAIPPLARPSPD
jgi:putative signal transducing protein